MYGQRWFGLLAAAVLAGASACSTPPSTTPDAGSGTPDGGTDTTPDAGAPLPGPQVKEAERLGGYLPARIGAVLPGTKTAWIGYVGQVSLSPEIFGQEDEKNATGHVINAGLVGLDQQNGRARLYGHADGLPETTYADIDQDAGKASVSFFDLAWIVPDQSFVAASWTRLVKGTQDADGQAKSFTDIALRAPGQSSDASIGRVAVAGGEIFVGTDQGVAVVDPQTFAVKRWLDLGVPRGWVYGLAAGDSQGAAVAVLFATAEDEAPSRVSLARPGQADTARVLLPNGSKVGGLGAMQGRFLVGVKDVDGHGTVLAAAFDAAGDVALTTFLGPEQFTLVSTKEKPFLPGQFAEDAATHELYVGGLIASSTPGASGGLVRFHLAADGTPDGALEPAIPREDPFFWLLPWQVDSLHVDAQSRVWITGRQLCDEHRARQMGLIRLEIEGKERRLVRPLVSGVRTIAIDPAEGNVWLGLRDENAGMACEGMTVQSGVCRLKADGSCEIYAPDANDDMSEDATNIPPDLGAARIAFGTNARKQMAIATRKNATIVRDGDTLTQRMTQFSPGLDLYETSAAWSDGGALWIGSEMEWDEAPVDPNDPDPIDWVKVNDRSPHGLGYLAYAEDVDKSKSVRRYSRNKSDIAAWDVAGMPSNFVWDVLPLPGKQHALAALGTERTSRAYDHTLSAAARSNAKGGLAEVEDDTIHVVQPPAGVTFGDVVALAKADDGRLFALDAQAGVVEVDLLGHESRLVLPAVWTAPERALSLAVDAAGHLAVGTTRSLYVYGANGGATKLSERKDGYVWSVRFTQPGVLLAGTDRGLVRVALDTAQLPTTLGPAHVLAREPWPLTAGCNGAEDCRCHGDDYCAYGSDCVYVTPMEAYCHARVDACAGPAKGELCACAVDADCKAGLECACGGNGSCLCTKAANGCGGVAGCACSADSECADGFHCESGIAGSSCVEGLPACAAHCTCATDSGCPGAMTCQGGFAGSSCR